MTDLAEPGVSYAEANWGRWIARCVRPWCTNAMALERGQGVVVCADGPDACGQVATVSWPADPGAIEEILAMRPVRRTQNWLPGEDLEQLLAENAAHDCIPPQWRALEAGAHLVIADIVDQRVVGGLLHQQLEAAGRRAIGGQ